jgi:hypothetical protein
MRSPLTSRHPFAIASALTVLCLAATLSGQSNRAGGLVLRGPSLVDVPLDGALPRGPSILLSYANGASPYSGIGRFEGRATCTAFFIATALPSEEELVDTPAYALTSGHCAATLDANEVAVNRPGGGRIVFNYFVDNDRWQEIVPVARVAYATTKGRDVAVLELAIAQRDLVRKLVRPWRIIRAPELIVPDDQIAIVGAPLWRDMGESFLRVTTCNLEHTVPLVIEHTWFSRDLLTNRCRDILPGSSGSPVISAVGKMVLGMVGSTTIGAVPMTSCALDHPCEPTATGAPQTRSETTYITPLAGIYRCFDERRRFTAGLPDCPLDPGLPIRAMPPFIGGVNPLLTQDPFGSPRSTWHVTVAGAYPLYRYAIVRPPDDCRNATYGDVLSTATTPVIDASLPVTEGFAFLCIAGVTDANRPDVNGAWATMVTARIDVTPPHLPAQVRITDDEGGWTVRFATVGDEVAKHTYKYGPAKGTRCHDAAGYQVASEPAITIAKTGEQNVFCAIPYDAAHNAGKVLERKLP